MSGFPETYHCKTTRDYAVEYRREEIRYLLEEVPEEPAPAWEEAWHVRVLLAVRRIRSICRHGPGGPPVARNS